MDIGYFILLFLGGATAGLINTLAGNGSAITLFLLMEFGLDANTANGTNRVGTLFQSAIAVFTFQRSSKLQPILNQSHWLLIPVIISALIGAYVATIIDTTAMKDIIRWLMVAMLLVILIKPKRWLRKTDEQANRKNLLNFLLLLCVGFYGGFIQMGMGIIFLAVLVLSAKYSLVDANILKLVVVLIYTIPVLFIFIWQGQVNWIFGLSLAAGQSLGAWAAARFALGHPKANIWIHRLLVVMVLLAIIRLF